MEHLPEIAALFAAFTWAVGSVWFGRLLATGGSGTRPTAAAANTFKNVLALTTFFVVFTLVGGAWPPLDQAGWLVLSGLLGFAVGDSLYFAALARAGVQTAAMVVLLNVPLAAVLDRVLYGSVLGPRELAGIAATLVGVLLVVGDPRSRTPSGGSRDAARRRTGVLLALAVACVMAIAVVVGGGEAREAGLLPLALLRMLGGVLGALPIAIATTLAGRGAPFRELAAPFRDRRLRSGLLWMAAGAAVVGLLPYHYALRGLPGGLAAVLFATTPLFTLLLGRFAGERHGPIAAVGTLVGIAGVVLIVTS